MQTIKPCHRGLKVQSQLFGFEAVDFIIMAPGFYLASVLAHRLFFACIITLLTAIALRLNKSGKLPGHTQTIIQFLGASSHKTPFQKDPP